MKKFAMLIATLLIVCVMACACGTTSSSAPKSENETSTQTSTPASTPESTTPGTQTSTPASTPESTNPGTNPGTPATGAAHAFFDFSSLALAKDTPMAESYDNGFFTATEGCKYTTSIGKTAKDGNLTKFLGACQLGKSGSYGAKSLQFTVSGACTVEVYANYASSSAASGNLSLVSESATIGTTVVAKDIYVQSFTITAAGSYALCVLDDVSGINVWGIEIK